MSDDIVAEAFAGLAAGASPVAGTRFVVGGRQELRLYVAGSTPQSSRAITNLKTICETHLKDHYELTVVDLYEHMELAGDDHIDVTPTLIRQWPLPVRRVVGGLAQTDRVLQALDLPLASHRAA
ncbi:MAG: circadian clock protein KaiB [Verrucomicrobiota bacterium]|jgi:circadian clock protein KaiB